MALLMELIVILILFTIICVTITNHVEEHLEWAALNYPPAVVSRLIEQGKIQEKKPLPVAERLKKKLPVVIAFIVLLSALMWFVNGCRSFLPAFATCMIIWTVVDWYDALVLDCLWFCHSKKVRVSGTEDMEEAYHDYMFHIKGSAIGMILGLVVSALVGLVVAIAGHIF